MLNDWPRKPFAGINGSGKHANWSIGTDTGTENVGLVPWMSEKLESLGPRVVQGILSFDTLGGVLFFQPFTSMARPNLRPVHKSGFQYWC